MISIALYACKNCGVVHVVQAAICMRCADEELAQVDPNDFRPVSPERFRWLLIKVKYQAKHAADAQKIWPPVETS